jgi:hypothetical protein
MTNKNQLLCQDVNPPWDEWLSPEAFKALTGKPATCRQRLPKDRDTLVSKYARTIAKFDNDAFARAMCKVLDMYEVYLDAACELSDEEIDELCFRSFTSRKFGFDRFVQIAKLQKKAHVEIERGQMNGKKWAFDLTLLD